jgi:anti-sigma factor RsiW
MTEITRNVVLDLLPLYLADEVSPDTRALVEKYLETDPELASIAEQSAAMELASDIPIPLTKEDQMTAYKEAKRIMLLRTIVIAALISFVLTLVFALIVWAPVALMFINR